MFRWKNFLYNLSKWSSSRHHYKTNELEWSWTTTQDKTRPIFQTQYFIFWQIKIAAWQENNTHHYRSFPCYHLTSNRINGSELIQLRTNLISSSRFPPISQNKGHYKVVLLLLLQTRRKLVNQAQKLFNAPILNIFS